LRRDLDAGTAPEGPSSVQSLGGSGYGLPISPRAALIEAHPLSRTHRSQPALPLPSCSGHRRALRPQANTERVDISVCHNSVLYSMSGSSVVAAMTLTITR